MSDSLVVVIEEIAKNVEAIKYLVISTFAFLGGFAITVWIHWIVGEK